jgi:ferredoxin
MNGPSQASVGLETRPRAAILLERPLVALDRAFNALYTSRYSPLYQCGTLAILCLVILVVTGLYTLIFYRIGTPYISVAELEAQWWGGRWIRALHTYAADAMLLFAAVHLLRMLVQGRTWGPRVLAWITGIVLLAGLFFSGWTGMILVWDRQAQLLATEGARLLDVLPLFSEPMQRGFVSGQGVASSFFFLNLLIHILLPLWLLAMIWVHTLRVTKPAVFPPKRLALWTLAGLTALSVVWPVGHMPHAAFDSLPGRVPIDLFFNAWLIPAQHMPAQATLAAWGLVLLVLGSLPWWWRPGQRARLAPAIGDEQKCTGCTQCSQDCPYGAIAMVPAPEGNTATQLVARVNAKLCVSCGICAGSCAPMVIGPPGRAGRDHLEEARHFFDRTHPAGSDLVIMACTQGLGAGRLILPAGMHVYPVHCAAATHTSAIEYLLRRGAGGVYVLACPDRDCAFRFGPRWMRERLYEDREAELQTRVDKERVQIGTFGKADAHAALADMSSYHAEIRARAGAIVAEAQVEVEPECEPDEGGRA